MNKEIVLRFSYTDGRPLANQTIPAFLNDSPINLSLNSEGLTSLCKGLEASARSLMINHFEMLDLKTNYPTHEQVILFPEVFKSKASHFSESPSVNPIIDIIVIPPPLFVNLGEYAPLSTEAVQYFKHNGNNALLFIHGYNVALGEYGNYPQGYEFEKDLSIIETRFKHSHEHKQNTSLKFKTSSKQEKYLRTIAYDLSIPAEILAKFPELSITFAQYFSEFKPEFNPEGLGETYSLLNGTESHQWFTQMEYNFNRAAGFFPPHYQDYTRILGIHWPGCDSAIDFKQAEQNANQLDQEFCALIHQLLENNIHINIVALSLGSRLALRMMKRLVDKGYEECIEQVALWQAALPNSILTNDKNFENAYKATKKLIVLYSKEDYILQNLYAPSTLSAFSITHALGYKGVKAEASALLLQKQGRLIQADQSKYLHGHSYMKVPTQKLMQDIYQEYIIGGKHGIKQFGRYNLNNICVF